MDILIIGICIVAGFAAGMIIRGIFVPRYVGKLIFNESDASKPFFELHFKQDPKNIKTGEEVVFVIEVR